MPIEATLGWPLHELLAAPWGSFSKPLQHIEELLQRAGNDEHQHDRGDYLAEHGRPPVREKRSAPVKAHITPSLRAQLDLFVAQSNVTSLSDYLFEIIEEHVAVQSIRIAKQKLGRRVGNQ